ncbi:hypothetical protein Pan44_12640 [Caulifigura coniformis]|uniref:Uncharacterized protein n=1 Tax=Caulifigura coniformis TaxID=2527983 RepID=A0A517SAU1_9PLAN|nr:hypothetical protein [Caulifigura coniformis]QDT53248.1 hypothetical protein Pan44_12640 [Caulifigura coniformis]
MKHVAFAVGLLSLLGPAVVAAADVPRGLLTESAFNRALTEPLTARFDELELGQLLKTLGDERRLAFLLDRRVDPSRLVSWRTGGEPFLEAVSDRLSANNNSARAIGSTIFIGPESSVKKLRTVVALRMEELRAKGNPAIKQQFAVLRDHSLAWDEATEPREMLAEISRRWGIRVQGDEEMPYDLWPAGLLFDVNFVEALSLVLIQYDRTFEWNSDATSVTILPMPEKVWIERKHTVPASRRESLREEIGGVLNSIDHTLERDRLLVRGSIEEQERIATLLGQRPGKSTPTKVSNAPLKQRLFTLTAEKVKIGDAFEALREQGITINYDAAAFESAKIDFNRRVDLKLNKASADVFLWTLCEPLGIDYEIEGVTVTLKLKK